MKVGVHFSHFMAILSHFGIIIFDMTHWPNSRPTRSLQPAQHRRRRLLWTTLHLEIKFHAKNMAPTKVIKTAGAYCLDCDTVKTVPSVSVCVCVCLSACL